MAPDEDFLNMVPEKKDNKIVERTIHTIHTLRIYPDGKVFISKSISWLDKKGMVVKERKEKKPVKVKAAKIQKEEAW